MLSFCVFCVWALLNTLKWVSLGLFTVAFCCSYPLPPIEFPLSGHSWHLIRLLLSFGGVRKIVLNCEFKKGEIFIFGCSAEEFGDQSLIELPKLIELFVARRKNVSNCLLIISIIITTYVHTCFLVCKNLINSMKFLLLFLIEIIHKIFIYKLNSISLRVAPKLLTQKHSVCNWKINQLGGFSSQPPNGKNSKFHLQLGEPQTKWQINLHLHHHHHLCYVISYRREWIGIWIHDYTNTSMNIDIPWQPQRRVRLFFLSFPHSAPMCEKHAAKLPKKPNAHMEIAADCVYLHFAHFCSQISFVFWISQSSDPPSHFRPHFASLSGVFYVLGERVQRGVWMYINLLLLLFWLVVVVSSLRNVYTH